MHGVRAGVKSVQIYALVRLDDVELDGEVIQGTAESWRDRLRDTL